MVFKRFPTSSPHTKMFTPIILIIYTQALHQLCLYFTVEIFAGLIGAFGRDDDDNHADDHCSTLWWFLVAVMV